MIHPINIKLQFYQQISLFANLKNLLSFPILIKRDKINHRLISGLLRQLEITDFKASSETQGDEARFAFDSDLTTVFKSLEGATDPVPYLKASFERAVVQAVQVVNKYRTITSYCKKAAIDCRLSLNGTEVYLHDEWEGEFKKRLKADSRPWSLETSLKVRFFTKKLFSLR